MFDMFYPAGYCIDGGRIAEMTEMPTGSESTHHRDAPDLGRLDRGADGHCGDG
jgi:hypothetical protein